MYLWHNFWMKKEARKRHEQYVKEDSERRAEAARKLREVKNNTKTDTVANT